MTGKPGIDHAVRLPAALVDHPRGHPSPDHGVQQPVSSEHARHFINVAGRQVLPEIVIGVAIVVAAQVLGIDLIQERFTRSIEAVLIEACVGDVIESVTPGVIDRTLEAFAQTTIQRCCQAVVIRNTLIGEFADSTKTRIWRRGRQGAERTHFAEGVDTVLLNREIAAVVADISEGCYRLVTERLLDFEVPFCVSGILEVGGDGVVVGTSESRDLGLNAAQGAAIGKRTPERCIVLRRDLIASPRAEDRNLGARHRED